MATGTKNSKQMISLGILGVILLLAIFRAIGATTAGSNKAMTATPGMAVNGSPSGPASQAPVAGQPGSPSLSKASVDAALLVAPKDLRNPFRASVNELSVSSSVAQTGPSQSVPAPISSLSSAVRPLPDTPGGLTNVPPRLPDTLSAGLALHPAGGVAVSPIPLPGTVTSPVTIPHVLSPEEQFQADVATLRSGLVVHGVIVGSPSMAFVSYGQDKASGGSVHIGDPLPGNFVVSGINIHGIEAVSTRRQCAGRVVLVGF